MNLAWSNVGRVHVVVHGKHAPTDEEWHVYLSHLRSSPHEQHLDGPVVVVSHGGAPRASQRRSLEKALAGATRPCAFLTVSRVARSIGAAVGWFNRDLQVFWLSEFQEACKYLRLRPGEIKEVTEEVARLGGEVGVVMGDSALG